MKGKINYNAIDTWLEPYIGYIMNITWISKSEKYCKILMDYGDKYKNIKIESNLITK